MMEKGQWGVYGVKKKTSATEVWTNKNILKAQSVFVRGLTVDSTCTHPDRETPQAI